MPSSSIFHPDFKPMPYWWEAWHPEKEPPADVPSRSDVVVIGGGFAGLSAALELKRAGVEVTVLEAQFFGFGASTRNGGAVSGGVNIGKGLGGRKTGQAAADFAAAKRALVADGADSFTFLDDLIRREAIECHWERCGRFVGAYTKKHYDTLSASVEFLNEVAGAEARMLPRAQVAEEIDSAFYRGGMVVGRSGKLHPALYYKGLLEACRRQGVRLCAATPAGRITGKIGAFSVPTPRGAVAAGEVIIATNGYTGDATPGLKRKVIPVASHIIATEELDEGLARSLIPRGRTISDTPRILTYYRMSPDGKRMVFGGRSKFTAVTPEISAPILHRFMTDRLPQLKGVRVTHAWTGNVAFTFDFLPHMGREDGMHYALGCNGSGVAMMTYLGNRIARKIIGGGNRVTAFEDRPAPDQWGYAGNPWFLPMVGTWYRLRDRVDRWRDGA